MTVDMLNRFSMKANVHIEKEQASDTFRVTIKNDSANPRTLDLLLIEADKRVGVVLSNEYQTPDDVKFIEERELAPTQLINLAKAYFQQESTLTQ